jgi:hypothetical protein
LPLQDLPSKSWFIKWLHNNKSLHIIKTKPIALARLDSHTEQDVRDWFQKYRDTLAEYKITNSKLVLNIDESGARVRCPAGQYVVVPVEVKELYTASPENRKSVTIIETIIIDRKPLLPFVITPGKKIIDNWIADKLIGIKEVVYSPTGYTNNEIALQYLDHLIKYSHAGSKKPWRILLLDGHKSHCTDLFQLKAAKNNIKLFYFLSHLTYILQLLDVSIFCL